MKKLLSFAWISLVLSAVAFGQVKLPWTDIASTPTSAAGYGIANGANIDSLGAVSASNYLLSTGSYSNPSWLTGLAYSKITGAPSTWTWSSITGTPTSAAGYGITNGAAIDALGAVSTNGLLKRTGSSTYASAVAGTDYSAPLTFSTGLTNTSGTITVNTSQNIATLSNLTTNGPVTTSGGTGALSVGSTTGSGNYVLATSPTISGPTLSGTTILSGNTLIFSGGSSIVDNGSGSSTLSAGGTNQGINLTAVGSGNIAFKSNGGNFTFQATGSAAYSQNAFLNNAGTQIGAIGTGGASTTAPYLGNIYITTGSGANLALMTNATLAMQISSSNQELQIPSTNTSGFSLYNTTDQVTNYERFNLDWSSNVANIRTQNGGTGTLRALGISSSNFILAGSAITLAGNGSIATNSGGGLSFNTTGGGTYSTTGVGWTGASTVSSGVANLFQLAPAYNQTGTAGGLGMQITETDTALGSGIYKFLDMNVAGGSWYSFAHGNASTTGNFNSSSATELAVQFLPSFAGQTGTAGWTALKLNVQDGTGSGTKLLQDWQLGGSSKANINANGNFSITGNANIGTAAFVTNGAAATPSYTFTSANTTGFYWANPGIGFSVAGAGVGTWTASGLTVSGSAGITAATSGYGLYLNNNSSLTAANAGQLSLTANNAASAGNALSLGNATFTGSSVAQVGTLLGYTINQTGTSAFTNLKLVTTETGKGSGNQRLIDAYAGTSGTTSEFYVDDAGNINSASSVITLGGFTLTMGGNVQVNQALSTSSNPSFNSLTVTNLIKHGGLVRTTAAVTATSSTTLTNVTGLSVNVAASTSYHFRVWAPTTAATSGGIQFAIGGTATATNITYEGYIDGATKTRASALATAVCSSATATTGTATIEGTIAVNAAGTLTVQFAQNTSNASASTVLQGATFEVFQTSN